MEERAVERAMLAKKLFLDDLDECEQFPKYFMIESINACNARCIMCGIYKSNRMPPPMHICLWSCLIGLFWVSNHITNG